MASVNFGNFTLVTPQINDFLVGYRNGVETRTTIDSLTGLNVPYFNTLSILNNKSVLYDSVYTFTLSNSSRYESNYTSVTNNSSFWNSVYNYVKFSSAGSQEVEFNMTDVRAQSANWDAAYLFVRGTETTPSSANFLDTLIVASDYKQVSASILKSYSYVTTTSSTLDSIRTTAVANSASWYGGEIAYTYVFLNSASDFKVRFNMSEVRANSANWDGAYYFVRGTETTPSSADFLGTLDVANAYRAISASYVTTPTLTSTLVSVSALAVTQNFSAGGRFIVLPNLPTSPVGLPAGALWNSGGTLRIA